MGYEYGVEVQEQTDGGEGIATRYGKVKKNKK
jgi:predicted RNA-binding protein with TRAM domain